MRAYVLDNVAMWFEDFHVDGLRLDAVHALVDSSTTHLLEEMGQRVAALSAHHRRPMTLIAEWDGNDTAMVTPREAGGTGLDAQWSDDFHHAVHVALTGETQGYYADFAPLSALAKVVEKGFFHDGTFSSFRGADHGSAGRRRADARLAPGRLQPEPRPGRQPRPRRPARRESLDDDQLAAAALLTLAGPFTPMLFQGEEWAASTPFAFFTSHPEEDLGHAVSEGRKREFEKMAWDTETILDPQDPATFAASKLDWSEVVRGAPRGGAGGLPGAGGAATFAARAHGPRHDDGPPCRTTRRRAGSSCDAAAPGGAVAAVNFSDVEVTVPLEGGSSGRTWTALWQSPAGVTVRGDELVLPPHASCLLR